MSMSHHHICPTSVGGSKTDKKNIVVINKRKHDQFHAVFSNRKPDQCVKYLVEYFFNGQWHWVNKALAHASESVKH